MTPPNAPEAPATPTSQNPWASSELQRVLLVSAEPWARNVLSLISQCSDRYIEVTHAIDGAQGLYYMSQSISNGTPYQLLILTDPLAQLSAESTIKSLRAIELGLNRPPYPCLICTSATQPPEIIARYPQTLHLRVPNSPQAASMVSASILQILFTLRAYRQSDERMSSER